MNIHTAQDRLFALADGRQIGYAEYGVPNGNPVLFFHGAPGSRNIHADMADIAARRGIRLIAIERPGYGLSDPQPGRALLDWPDDIAALADALGLQRFALIGFSMGSVYALACAYKLSGRVTKIALAGAFAPLSVPGVLEGMSPMVSGLLAQTNPEELSNSLAAVAPSPLALVEAMSASATEWDKNMINARRDEFVMEYTQTLHNGIEGFVSDIVLASGSWGFMPGSIKTEACLWSGTGDQNTPPAMTRYLSRQLPNCHAFMLPGEGHFALYRHWEEILEHLV